MYKLFQTLKHKVKYIYLPVLACMMAQVTPKAGLLKAGLHLLTSLHDGSSNPKAGLLEPPQFFLKKRV
ncbi:MAG: hypothetical protein AAGK05_11690 [Pseudomonadota bacterium]